MNAERKTMDSIYLNGKELLRYSENSIENIRCGDSLKEINVEVLLGEITNNPHEWNQVGQSSKLDVSPIDTVDARPLSTL